MRSLCQGPAGRGGAAQRGREWGAALPRSAVPTAGASSKYGRKQVFPLARFSHHRSISQARLAPRRNTKLFLSSVAHLSTTIPSHLFLTQSDNMFWVKITPSPFQAEALGVGEMRAEAARSLRPASPTQRLSRKSIFHASRSHSRSAARAGCSRAPAAGAAKGTRLSPSQEHGPWCPGGFTDHVEMQPFRPRACVTVADDTLCGASVRASRRALAPVAHQTTQT